MECSYLTSAQKAMQLPQFEMDEIAFIGRSNCGKSSLINAITNRKNLARSSSTPGRTQMVHFFKCALASEQQKILVDLPGYGFNVAPREVKKLWDELLLTYLQRDNIRYFCVLFDIRREIEDFEWDFVAKLCEIRSVVLVLTKTDKCNTQYIQRRKNDLKSVFMQRALAVDGLFTVSNTRKKGIPELRNFLFSFVPEREQHS